LACLLLALAGLLGALAAAPRAQATDVAASIAAARARVGLPALQADPAAATIADIVAHPRAVECPGDCAAIEGADGKLDLDKYYDYLTGTTRQVDVVGVSDADLPAGILSTLGAVIGDPRVSGFAVADSGVGRHVVVFVLDPAAAFTKPVLLSGSVNFAGTLHLLVAGAPPARTRLLDGRGRVIVGAVRVDTAGALAGSTVVSVSLPGLPLQWGRSYLLQVGTATIRLRTPAFPASVAHRDWQFQPSMTAADRRVFESAFARAPLLYRQVAGLLNGLVTVSAGSTCGAAVSCARSGSPPSIVMNPQHLADPLVARFVTLHEFGHIVEFYALDDEAQTAFEQLFVRSPRWRTCFRDTLTGGCAPMQEILADQFAFWASGDTRWTSGYSDPPLATPAQFEAVLRRHLALRIVPGLMPPALYTSAA